METIKQILMIAGAVSMGLLFIGILSALYFRWAIRRNKKISEDYREALKRNSLETLSRDPDFRALQDLKERRKFYAPKGKDSDRSEAFTYGQMPASDSTTDTGSLWVADSEPSSSHSVYEGAGHGGHFGGGGASGSWDSGFDSGSDSNSEDY